MTTPTPLPLDAAALDRAKKRINFGDWPADNTLHALLSQARAALTLAARVAECVRAAAAVTGTDAEMCATEAGADTNHGVVLAALDWQAKRVAELEAVHNALRDALVAWQDADHEGENPSDDGARWDGLRELARSLTTAALAATPAASLAAHDAEVLERVAAVEHEQWMQWAISLMDTEPGLSHTRVARWRSLLVPYAELSEEMKEHDRKWARLSLAAQAQEVTK